MTTLMDLLDDVREDLLQESWDKRLIEAFRSKHFRYVNVFVKVFLDEEKVPIQRLNTLKRTPKHVWQFGITVPRFVAAYLPKLNDLLWDSNMTDQQILEWLGKSNLDTLKSVSDYRKSIKDYRLLYKTRATDKKARVETAIDVKTYQAGLRSNWKAVKK